MPSFMLKIRIIFLNKFILHNYNSKIYYYKHLNFVKKNAIKSEFRVKFQSLTTFNAIFDKTFLHENAVFPSVHFCVSIRLPNVKKNSFRQGDSF